MGRNSPCAAHALGASLVAVYKVSARVIGDGDSWVAYLLEPLSLAGKGTRGAEWRPWCCCGAPC